MQNLSLITYWIVLVMGNEIPTQLPAKLDRVSLITNKLIRYEQSVNAVTIW